MSYSTTASETYSTLDVENVVGNFGADLRMIAESSGTWTREYADKHVADIEFLAKNGYIEFIDVTLLSNGVEQRAVRYTVNESSGELQASRPGGVLWPRTDVARLRLVVRQSSKWTSEPPDRSRLKLPWGDSYEDISHSTLNGSGGRNFVSSAYGFERKDYSK